MVGALPQKVASVFKEWVIVIVKGTDLSVLQDHSRREGEEQEEVLEEETPHPPFNLTVIHIEPFKNQIDFEPHKDPGYDSADATVPERSPVNILRFAAFVDQLMHVAKPAHTSVHHETPRNLNEVEVAPQREEE